MKNVFRLFVVTALMLSVSAFGQGSQAPAAAKPAVQMDVYHVHFNKAAIGKAAELGKALSTPDPKESMPTHFIVLRHQEGDDWDYCVIQHLGKSATVDATPSTMAPAMRDLSAWHGDTFVSGPTWAEFTKAMGIDQTGKTGGDVYIVSTFRAAPGHREQLEKTLKAPTQSKVPTGEVVMQHLEGAPWNYITVTRYNSWQDLATDRSAPPNAAAWAQTREDVASHHDTIADRIAPK